MLFIQGMISLNLPYLLITLSFLLVNLFVIPIGGASAGCYSLTNVFQDMACAAGFVITNNVLIVAGSLLEQWFDLSISCVSHEQTSAMFYLVDSVQYLTHLWNGEEQEKLV